MNSECQVKRWLEDARKLGIVDSKICEIGRTLADGKRKRDGQTGNDDHAQNRDEALSTKESRFDTSGYIQKVILILITID